MKLSIVTILSTLALSSAWAPASKPATSVDSSRKEFLGLAGAAVFGLVAMPTVSSAMDQENISDKTEQWETGSPTPEAEVARIARFTNARTQMNSNFPPQKRLTLERKSPVTRLDINAPDFTAYKKTYPGLFRDK